MNVFINLHSRGLSLITTTLRATMWSLSSGSVATLVAAEIVYKYLHDTHLRLARMEQLSCVLH